MDRLLTLVCFYLYSPNISSNQRCQKTEFSEIVNKSAEKFIKTEYGRAIVKKAKAGVIRLTSDDLKADVIILRG